jgi:hypothetical protein
MTLVSRPGGETRHDERRASAARPLVMAVDRTLISFDVLGWLWRGRVKRQLAKRFS